MCTVALAADLLDVHRLRRMLEHGLTAPPPAPVMRTLPRAKYLRPAHQYALPFHRPDPADKESA